MTGAPIQDLDRVTLRSEQVSRAGTRVPAGSTGTVVAVLKGGEAYMVEFMRPVEAVVTVEPGDLTPAKPCEIFAGLGPPNPAVEDLQNVRTFRGAPRPAPRSNPRWKSPRVRRAAAPVASQWIREITGSIGFPMPNPR